MPIASPNRVVLCVCVPGLQSLLLATKRVRSNAPISYIGVGVGVCEAHLQRLQWRAKRLSSYLTSRDKLEGAKSGLHLRHGLLEIEQSSGNLLLNLAGLSPGGRVGSDLVKSLGCEAKSQYGFRCGVSQTACCAAPFYHVPDMLRVCEYVVRRGVGGGAVRDKVRSYHSNSQSVRRRKAGAKIWRPLSKVRVSVSNNLNIASRLLVLYIYGCMHITGTSILSSCNASVHTISILY